MSPTYQIINIIVLVIVIGFALHSLSKSGRERNKYKKKKEQEDAEMKQWQRGAEIASHDREYMEFVNEITPLGKEYDPHKWYFTMPDSALKHLEACYEGDERKVYLMKRAIELSIEHFAHEMEDDAECARIIEERVFNNPKPSVPFDIEQYKRYRDERTGSEEKFETFEEWKKRNDISESGTQ